MSKTIGVISLGCSKNRVNTEQMMFLLSQAGYVVSGDTDVADIVLLNTCGFIDDAKSEAVEMILELIAAKDEGRIGKIIVAGCLPQREREVILSELPEIDAVVGTGSFDDIVNVVRAVENNEFVNVSDRLFFDNIDAPVSETPRIISTSASWAYLKIAEGCDNRCAFCSIPDIRGKFRSRPMENIISEARRFANAGIQELIIVAQDVTRYGFDIYGKNTLSALLHDLNSIENLKWIRLHYLYPDKFDDELIDVIAKSGKILKYLDIPIQHINDEILRKMNRRGSSNDIKNLFTQIRERIPGVVLRTSLITGLPGEGESEFEELRDFLHEARIERVGVFAYSPEEGTPAAKMERPSKNIAEERAALLLDLQSEIMHEWNKSRVDSIMTVLIEGVESDDAREIRYLARSYAESPEVDGYITVKASKPLINTFLDIRIIGIENGRLIGEPV
ncbi:MAG: 30S ribosomal protein S12 methylthiotransferase RimO [Oscillospiraceae bacterium]|nr:30S ribosomal protein S12 methylthiotransferase RimO [Oscillospiraceae bacterium]